MGGEICNDFEDNDGDGLIDLADPNCAGPATQGALTAPTTPQAPPSVINTTATNSTSNTLTSGLIGLPSSPATPPPTTTTTPIGGEQGQQQPPSSAETTPQSPPTTTTTPLGGQEQQAGTTSPDSSSASGTTTFPGGISITKISDGSVAAKTPDGTSVERGTNGRAVIRLSDNTQIYGGGGEGETAGAVIPGKGEVGISPDGVRFMPHMGNNGATPFTVNPDGTLTTWTPTTTTDPNTGVERHAHTTTTYFPDGTSIALNPDGTSNITIPRNPSDMQKIISELPQKLNSVMIR
jgi:hypothetical protein